MSPDFTLRPVPYDHPDPVALTKEVQRYYAELYGSPDEAPVDPAQFAAPNGAFLVGYLDEVPVSMGGWRFSAEAIPGAWCPVELKRMFVRPDYRRRGLAAATLRALEADAIAAGADWLILESGRPQVDALDFYRSQGYIDIPKFGFYADYVNSVSLGRPIHASGHV